MRRPLHNFFQEKFLFLLCILIGVIHGTIYIFIAPPWAHYDEPTHFEYTWMIANREFFPKAGEVDILLRRQIMQSMIANDFFRARGGRPDINKMPDPVNIGITQLGDPPIYYLIASIPLRFMRNQPIENQLIAGRFVSLILFLAAVAVGWKFSREVAGKDNPIRWMIPLTMVLLPPLVELMSAESSDSAALLVYSLFLLFGVQLLRQGLKIKYILVLALLVVIGFFTKSSTWLMGAAMVIGIIVSFFRKRAFLGWILVGMAFVMALFLLFEWGDAALWYRDTLQNETTRIGTQFNGEKSFAIRLIDDSTERDVSLYQTLPKKYLPSNPGSPITIGVWMWAEQPILVNPPQFMVLNDKGQRWINAEPVMLTQQPVFYAYKIKFPAEAWQSFIVLKPFDRAEPTGTIYYAKPVVAAGTFDVWQIPAFSDANASRGEWAGKPFTNLVRNAGTIQSWPKFRDFVYAFVDKIDYRLTEGIGRAIYALDFKGAFWYTKSTLLAIFRSFWAKFGWGEVTLAGAKPYRPFIIATIIMLAGCLLGISKKFSWDGLNTALWLGVNIFLSLGFAWFTGISMNSFVSKPHLPVARFIFPAILAILTFWSFGWIFWMELFSRRYRWLPYSVYVLLFIILDVLSIITVVNYYQA